MDYLGWLSAVRLVGLTLDISSHGVLLACRRGPDVGDFIECLIRLHGGGAQVVKLRCAGRVVRAYLMSSNRDQPRLGYLVAVIVERYQFERRGGIRTLGIDSSGNVWPRPDERSASDKIMRLSGHPQIQ